MTTIEGADRVLSRGFQSERFPNQESSSSVWMIMPFLTAVNANACGR